MKKIKKFSIQKLFFNNKFAFVFSVITAFFIWATVVINLSPTDTRVVEDVKVTVQNNSTEGMELELFGFDESMTVDVTVTGRRYAISTTALTADDITIVAKSSYVDSAGSYTLNLTAEPVDPSAAFDIVSLSKTTVSVFYDTLKTEEFNVEAELTAEKVVPDGYIYDDPIASLTTVSVTGPATEVNKIERVVAFATLDTPITETANIKAEVVAQTANNSMLNYVGFVEDTTSCTVTVPVYMKKEINLAVRYLNAPAMYSDSAPKVTISPAKLNIAAAKTVLDELDVLYIGSLDFNRLTAENNVLTFKTSAIEEVQVIDNIQQITVSVDFSSLETTTLTLPAANVNCLNVAEGYTAVPQGINSVIVVGPKTVLDELTNVDLSAKVDLSSIGATEGTVNATADVTIKGHDNCWIYGKYKINVVLTKQ